MRFAQTSDILQHQIAPYHQAVSSLYQELAKQNISPRNRLLLDYLIEHEDRLALAIHDFIKESHAQTMEYWFKRIELPFPDPDASPLVPNCLSNLDTLIGAAICYKTKLIEYLTHLYEQCDDDTTKHLFKTLKIQEETGMKRMIRHGQGLADL